MNCAILVLLLATSVIAAPKLKNAKFRNVYKKPLHEIESPSPDPRIIGGQEAVPHSIPYQAFVEVFSNEEYWLCGGSVISRNYLLTAGHCCVDAIQAYITLGAHRPMTVEDTQLNIFTEDITPHEDFYQDMFYIINDVCVMKFPQPLTFNEYIQASVLPSRADAENLFEGAAATASGWGLVDGLDNEISDVLNVVNLTVIRNRLCEQTFGPIFPSVICTSGAMNSGVCNGDSGGPLVVDGVQVGVVSFGVELCRLGYPSAYSRITRFLDWIEEHTDVKIN